MDLRQSPRYVNHLKLLGWKIEKVDNCQIFIRQFSLVGSFIKIQRPETIPPIEKLLAVVKKYRARQILIEPKEKLRNSEIQKLRNLGFRPSSPFLPSKTLYIDLTRFDDKIFASFASPKKRAIKRAIKNRVVIKESEDIGSFIKLKNKQHGFSGEILRVDGQFKALWQAFRPKKAVLLLAFSDVLLGGILLLFHDQVAYYYQAASTKQGNQLAAPSLLVWEALKTAKKRGCKTFDFEGIYDSRFPQKSWLGFTNFKKGFGGKEILRPISWQKSGFSLAD